MRWIKKLLWFILLFTAVSVCAMVGYYFIVTKDAVLQKEKLLLGQQNICIYDRYGEIIQNVGIFSNRQSTPIEEIPQHTKNAFICVEDKRFYQHNGFDSKRIFKAVYNNAKAHAFREGASTISQQLIKNTHLSQEKTVKRKLREWKLTRALEREYTKDEILEKYLNTIYFGHSCFGIRSASEFYFGKLPSALNLSESAILAGLVKSPNNYSPFKNPQRCETRKKTVLGLMANNGYIDKDEEINAICESLPIQPTSEAVDRGYFHLLFDELSEITSASHLRLGGNIEIFTEFDPDLQKQLQEATAEISSDKSAFVLDGHSGLFKACISTIGNAKRLPGSVIKPLLVYAPALEENLISPATPILDEKVNYGGYTPENYNGKYHGYISAREALAKSLNIPAVKLLQSLGVQKGSEYLGRLHLTVDKEDESLALALGGMKHGFSLQNLTNAYASLLNSGKFSNCGFIQSLKINDILVYRFDKKERAVFSKETAYLTTDILKTAVKEGTAKKLRNLPFDIACKTGTVGTSKGNTDAYAIAYTTQDVTSVWLGNADNQMISDTGGGTPCHILQQINHYLYGQYGNIPAFNKPSQVVEVSLDKISYYDTHTIQLSDDNAPVNYRFTELFNKRHIPAKKSDFFSNPSILPPTVNIRNGQVVITLQKDSPTVYQYCIVRYDYATHTTVYKGAHFDEFCDASAKPNQKYIYTVTPIYNEHAGVGVTLPSISTDTQFQDDQMTEKEWWKY
ncbi:MAG: penicillin-binding protein [Clostridiales bacterium]|nr:penicillin-binding protein [Clostridiales bacterium]